MRRWTILAALFLAVLAASGACVPATNSPDVTFVQQVLPNDSEATATELGGHGLYSFAGYCQPVDTASATCPSKCSDSWFTANASAGPVELKLYVQSQAPTPPGGGTPPGGIPSPTPTPSEPLEVSLKLLDSAGTPLGQVGSITPEAPGSIAASMSGAQHILVDVGCTGRDLHFTGTISVP